MSKKEINCKYYEDATIFDMDFNEKEYKYCMLFDDECIKIRKTKKCVYNLKQQLKHTKQVNEELKKRNINLKLALDTYQMPEVVKVLTDWKTGELQLQENKLKKYEQTLEKIKEIVIKATDISYSIEVNSMLYDIKDKINEVLYG